MKTKLALLGLGSRSTIFYLSELNSLYNHIKGGYSTCPFVVLNTDFNEINSLLPNTSEQLNLVVKQFIIDIEKLDIQYLLIPNITLHETIDRLGNNTLIIHPIALTISKIKQNNWTKIVLFGSLHSMTSLYISSSLKSEGIQVMLPSKDDMEFIDHVRKQIYSETETEELIEKYHAVIKRYSANTPIILSCTELSILKPKRNNNLLDMADVQIEEAVKRILS